MRTGIGVIKNRRNRGGASWIVGDFNRVDGAQPVMGPRLARVRWRLLSGHARSVNVDRDGAERPASLQIPGIGNKPNDGAEKGRDHHVARLIVELMHARDYAARTTGDQIAID